MGSSNENSGLRPGPEPVGPHARPGRLVRRQRRGRGGRHGAVGDRHRHRRLDPPAGEPVRDRRNEAHLRRDQPLRDDRLRLLARPVRPAHPRRDRRRHPPEPPPGPRPVRLHLARHRRRRAAAHGRAPRRPALRHLGDGGGGARAGRGRAGERSTLAKIEELGGGVEPIELPTRRPRHRRLLRDRAGRGEREPRPLRRRALRPAGRRQRRPHLAVRADPPRRLRRGGQAPHHDRHLRALVGLLRGLLRHGPEGAHAASPRTSRRRSRRSTSSSARRSATVAFKLGERTAGPARDVPLGLLHRADAAGRHPGDLDSRAASRTACRWASRSRDRPSARRASWTPRTRSRRASPSRGCRSGESTSRSSASRSTSS